MLISSDLEKVVPKILVFPLVLLCRIILKHKHYDGYKNDFVLKKKKKSHGAYNNFSLMDPKTEGNWVPRKLIS